MKSSSCAQHHLFNRVLYIVRLCWQIWKIVFVLLKKKKFSLSCSQEVQVWAIRGRSGERAVFIDPWPGLTRTSCPRQTSAGDICVVSAVCSVRTVEVVKLFLPDQTWSPATNPWKHPNLDLVPGTGSNSRTRTMNTRHVTGCWVPAGKTYAPTLWFSGYLLRETKYVASHHDKGSFHFITTWVFS